MGKVHRAAKAGDTAKLEEILASDPGQLEARRWWGGETPLLAAIHAGQAEAACFLIGRGANVNAKDRKGRTHLPFFGGETALLAAVRMHQQDTVGLLIERGANVNARDRRGRTPLHMLYWGPDFNPLIDVLIEHGADVHSRNPSGRTPLHMTGLMGSVPLTARLIEAGADVNARDTDGVTALHLAAFRGFDRVVELLLAKGADPSLRGTLARNDRFRDVTPASVADNMIRGCGTPSERAHYERAVVLLDHAQAAQRNPSGQGGVE